MIQKNLDDGASGLLSSYTAEMRKVIDAYFRNSTPAADTYYLFVVEGAKDKNKMGYMPRKKQAGFLFTSAITNEYFVHTLAHELGHGAFRLEHTFEEYATLGKGTTDNLMDYGTGTRLNKYQWDYIHDPVAVLGLFEEDEEGEMMNDEIFCKPLLVDILTKIRSANLKSNESVSFRWSNKLTCELTNIGLTDQFTLSKLLLELPMVSSSGEIVFNSRSFRKSTKTEYGAMMGNVILYEFGDFEDESNPIIKVRLAINENDEVDLENFIFPNREGQKVVVRIVTQLVEENKKNSFSSFEIDGGLVRGYFIERDGQPENMQRVAGSLKRIPANEYVVVRNDCKKFYDDLGRERRPNCSDEFRLITTPEKSGRRSGILIHTGAEYEDSKGCLLPIGTGYKKDVVDFSIGGAVKSINIYKSNGTTLAKLNEINAYIKSKEVEAQNKKLELEVIIVLNR